MYNRCVPLGARHAREYHLFNIWQTARNDSKSVASAKWNASNLDIIIII